VQVDSGQYRDSASANVRVVAPDGRCLAWYRRQIGRGQPNGLNTELLIDTDGVDGLGSGVMNGTLAIDRNIPVDHQNFLHLAVELRIARLKVVADFVGLDVVFVEDAPHGALASLGEAVETGGPGGALAHETGQCREGPQLSGQAMILWLGASHAHHPGLGRIGDLGFVRAVVLVLQTQTNYSWGVSTPLG
jgi:hypothetical protein